MSRRSIITSFFLGLALGGPALAANEARYAYISTAKGEVTFVDEQSLKRVGSERTVWMLVIYQPAIEVGGKMASRAKSRADVDCARTLIRATYLAPYTSDGQLLGQSNLTEPYRPIEPQTAGEALLKYVCTDSPPSGPDEFPLLSEEQIIKAAAMFF